MTTTFVVDASVVAAWLFEAEQTPASDRLLERLLAHSAWAPSLLPYEVRSFILKGIRRGQIAATDISRLVLRFEQLSISVSNSSDSPAIVSLALKHGLSAYDASYLALAKRERLPLATFDTALRRAASAEAVPVLPEADFPA